MSDVTAAQSPASTAPSDDHVQLGGAGIDGDGGLGGLDVLAVGARGEADDGADGHADVAERQVDRRHAHRGTAQCGRLGDDREHLGPGRLGPQQRVVDPGRELGAGWDGGGHASILVVRTTIVDHPLAAALLTRVRDEATGRADFQAAIDGLGGMLVYEATRSLPVEPIEVATPLTTTTGVRLAAEPFVVPVLRAGLGLLGPAQRLLPGSATGFIGVSRDEETFEPTSYLTAIPNDLEGRPVLLLDPMLATGGSLAFALSVLVRHHPGPITAVCVLAAPEGVARIAATGLVVELVVAAVDDHLNELAYIVPGLGDAGDRLFGAF